MSKNIIEKAVMAYDVEFPDEIDRLIQKGTYQSIGSWVRYFLNQGALSVKVTYASDDQVREDEKESN